MSGEIRRATRFCQREAHLTNRGRRWWVVATVAAMLMVCCVKAGPTHAAAAATNHPITLTVLASATMGPALKAEIAQFEVEHPNIRIRESIAPDAAMNELLPQQLATGNGADIFTDWPGVFSTQAQGALAKNGYLLDLSQQPWVGQLKGDTRKLSEYNGRVYFAPLVSLAFSTTYNQTALNAAGLNVPQTSDGVLKFCQAAQKKGLIPYALGGQTPSQVQMPAMAMGATIIARNLTWTEERAEGRARFATSRWLTVFEQFQKMAKSGCFYQPLGMSENVARSLVANGKALGFFGASSAFHIIQGMARHDRMIFTAFPATNNPKETLLCVGIGSGLSINAKTKYPQQAALFLAFMMEPAHVNGYANATGQVPAIPNSLFKPSDVGTAYIVKAMVEGRTAPLTNELWPNPRIVPAQRTVTQEMLAGSATPLDVAEAMDRAWNSK